MLSTYQHDAGMLIFLIKEFIVSKNKEPIVLPKEKIRGTYDNIK